MSPLSAELQRVFGEEDEALVPAGSEVGESALLGMEAAMFLTKKNQDVYSGDPKPVHFVF